MTYACSPSLNLFSERYHHANLARPMAAGEPVVVTARVEPSKQPRCGLSKTFLSPVPVLDHVEKLRDGDEACPTKGFPKTEKEFPRVT